MEREYKERKRIKEKEKKKEKKRIIRRIGIRVFGVVRIISIGFLVGVCVI